jgi:hypothetical protein
VLDFCPRARAAASHAVMLDAGEARRNRVSCTSSSSDSRSACRRRSSGCALGGCHVHEVGAFPALSLPSSPAPLRTTAAAPVHPSQWTRLRAPSLPEVSRGIGCPHSSLSFAPLPDHRLPRLVGRSSRRRPPVPPLPLLCSEEDSPPPLSLYDKTSPHQNRGPS